MDLLDADTLEQPAPPDKNFFDFHLRKPVLPPLCSLQKLLSKPTTNKFDQEEAELTSLVSNYNNPSDPVRMIADFFSLAFEIKDDMKKSCLVHMPQELLDHHTEIMTTVFGKTVSSEYSRKMRSMMDYARDSGPVRSLHFVGLTLQALVTWRNGKNYHSIPETSRVPYWIDPHHLKLKKLRGGSQVLCADFRTRAGNKCKMVVGHHLSLLIFPADRSYIVLSHDQLLMLQDTILSRWLTFKVFGCFTTPHIPGSLTFEELYRIYQAGDSVLKIAGNRGYNVLKFLEPICIGIVQKREDEALGDIKGGHFLSEIISDYYDAAEGVYAGAEAEELYNSLLDLRDTRALVQVYGLFRHWGHPTIEPLTGLEKLWQRGNTPIWVDPAFASTLADDLSRNLLLSYYRRHQTWPPNARINVTHSPLLHQCIAENRLPSPRESKSIGEKWKLIEYDNIFDVPKKIPIGMILEDRAHSKDLSDLIASLNRRRFEPVSKRLLITALEEAEIDVKNLLDRVNNIGFDAEELVIGLKAKERELKVEGRFFALMTFTLRIYFVATEWLIAKHVLPIFPEITMGDTFISLQKKIFNVTKTQKSAERSSVNFVISLDYEKWNAHQRAESTVPVFQVIDRAFGWTRVISRTHEVFEKSVFYYADYRDLLPKNLREDRPIVWHGHRGGMEGLRQKGWTTIGMLLLRQVMKRHSVQTRVLAQGDNQVLSLLYKTNVKVTSTQYALEVQKLRKKTERILEEIIQLSHLLGLPVKKDETWISRSVFLYGKIPVISGALRASVAKIVSRLYTTTNDAAPTLQNTLSSLLTSCLTLTQQTMSPILGITIFHWYGWELLSFGMNYNVLLGDSLYTALNKRAMKDHGVSLGERWRPTGDNTQTTLALDLFYRDAVIGGLGGSNLFRWLVRQFPDPLTETLSFAHKVLIKSTHRAVIRMGVRFLNPIMESGSQNFLRLVQDPTSIPIAGGSKSINIIKDSVYRYLDNARWVRNRVIIEAIQIRKLEIDRLEEGLQTITPCFPRFLSELWNASIVGRGEYYLGKLTSTASLVTMSRTRGRMNLAQKLKQAELSMCRIWLKQVLGHSEEEPPLCPSMHAQELRKLGWGKEVVGATVPHPSTQWEIHPCTRGQCDACVSEDIYLREKIAIHVNPVLTKNPYAIIEPGCFVPYLGSTTSEDSSTSPYGVLTTDEPLLKNAVHLLRSVNWIVEPNSNLHQSIENLLKSLTNAFDSGLPICEQTRSGSGCHRFQSERVSGGAFPGIGFTGLSHFCFNSNDLTVLGRGEENYAILFQGVISYYMAWLATLASCGERLSISYHLHPSCRSCLMPIPEIWLDTPSPITFPSLKGSSEFYINTEDVDIYELPKMALATSEFTQDNYESQGLSCGVGILFSVILQARSTGEILDSSDVINLSYFRAISPEIFTKALGCTFIMIEILSLARKGRIWKTDLCKLLDLIVQGAIAHAGQPDLFNKLTMVFLIAGYWQYCASNALLSGTSFPLTHQDGESAIRNWAYRVLEDKDTVWECLCHLATRSFWIFYDLNTFRLVTCYYIAGEVCSCLITGEQIPDSLRCELLQLDRSYPPKVKFGTPPLQVSLSSGRRVALRYTTLTLKNAIKHLPITEYLVPEPLVRPWRCNSVVSDHCIWDSRFNRHHQPVDDDNRTPFFYSSIGIHAIRLVCRLTSTPMKVAPIIRSLSLDDGVMYAIGDGTGGITAHLLGAYPRSKVIFNTLIDHHDEILQSTGTVVPPAVYLLPKSCHQRLLNVKDCSSGHTDLTDPETFEQLAIYHDKTVDEVTLIICDAEPVDDMHFHIIYLNMVSFLTKHPINPHSWVVIKLHLKREVSWSILDDVFNHWSYIKLMRSDYSRYGSSEVYACLQGWGHPTYANPPSFDKPYIMSEFTKYNPDSEYEFLVDRPHTYAWGSASQEDKARTKRIMSKVTALCSVKIAHPHNMSPLPIEAFNYILTVYWELMRVNFAYYDEPLSQSLVEKRAAAMIGVEMGLSLLFGCKRRFIELATVDWGKIQAGVAGRCGHSILSLRPNRVIWTFDGEPSRHLGADALRSLSAWMYTQEFRYRSARKDLKTWCLNSQIYKFLGCLSLTGTEFLIDEDGFRHILIIGGQD